MGLSVWEFGGRELAAGGWTWFGSWVLGIPGLIFSGMRSEFERRNWETPHSSCGIFTCNHRGFDYGLTISWILRIFETIGCERLKRKTLLWRFMRKSVGRTRGQLHLVYIVISFCRWGIVSPLLKSCVNLYLYPFFFFKKILSFG